MLIRATVLCALVLTGAFQTKSDAYKDGVLYGKIVDLNGAPVAGAVVAIEDRKGKVVGWSKTDAQGTYAVPANPIDVLELRPAHHRGLFESCVRTVGDVIVAPVKVVESAVDNPGRTAGTTLVLAADGTPTPLAAKAAAGLTGVNSAGAGGQARDLAARTAVGQGPHHGSDPHKDKGNTLVLVAAPGFKDARVDAAAYWMEAPIADKERPVGVQAWLDTIKMAPTAAPQKSDAAGQTLTLSDATAQPSLVAPGGKVELSVKIKTDPGVDYPRRVFAREMRKNTVVELTPKDGGVYAGTLTLDPKISPGETTICIGALRTQPVGTRLDPKKPDPLIMFVEKTDDMKPDKPYEYDPLIMASKNRLDVKVTVLPPHR